MLAELLMVDVSRGLSKMSTGICITSQMQVEWMDLELPAEWSAWPTRIELAFDLSTGGSVTSEDYSRFQANSLEDS